MSVLGRCPLSVLVNFIVNLMLGNYLTTILEENVFKKVKEEELNYKEEDICCEKMVLQWKLFTQTLSNKANQYFIA